MNQQGILLLRLFQRYRKTLNCLLLLLAGGAQPLTERALRTDLALKSISLTATEPLLVVAQSPCRRANPRTERREPCCPVVSLPCDYILPQPSQKSKCFLKKYCTNMGKLGAESLCKLPIDFFAGL